ncbi:MAG: response regulator [bacterium]|nr:response regulator [bacterium]
MKKNDSTIFIIDDDYQIRNALQWLFQSVHYKVETYESADLFLQSYSGTNQGCLIMDVRMPGTSGLELLEHFKFKKIRLPVIIITGFGDISMAVRAMKAGAVDFILKPFNEQCLLESVQKCVNDTIRASSLDNVSDRIEKLSDREKQIIDLILEGNLNKEIAYKLSISISTVEAHRANIMHKLEAKNVAHLIKIYLETQFNQAIP